LYQHDGKDMAISVWSMQGSGKSTFAGSLVKHGSTPWVRVNQDSLGSRAKCEVMCREALEKKHSVVIDRCNFDANQRRHWLNLARQYGAVCCALWIDVPVSLAADRASSRADHEGGVTGRAGVKLAHVMAAKIAGAARLSAFARL
jgi:predicted kinase